MAHAGKLWPLHFRRDLSVQQQDNKFGWAADYLVHFERSIGTVANALKPLTIVLTPHFAPGTAQMTGSTAPVIVAGKTVHLDVSLSQVKIPVRYEGTAKWSDNLGNLLYAEKWVLLPNGFYMVMGNDQMSNVTTQTAGVFEWGPGFAANFIQAKPWP